MSTKRETDFLLHDYIGHTNKLQPFSKEIGYEAYPTQESDVGTIITLKYRFRELPEYNDYEPVVHRPEDDVDYYKPQQYSEEEENNLMEENFLVLRHDVSTSFEPKLIAISEDYQKMLCIMLDQVTDLTTDCFIYPNQLTELAGLQVEPQYMASTEDPRTAYVVAATKAEPMFGIVVEFVDDSIFRVITTDEAQFLIPQDEVEYVFYNSRQIAAIRKEILLGKSPYVDNSLTNEDYARIALSIMKFDEG